MHFSFDLAKLQGSPNLSLNWYYLDIMFLGKRREVIINEKLLFTFEKYLKSLKSKYKTDS